MRSLSDYEVGDTFAAFHQGWGNLGPIYRIFTKVYEGEHPMDGASLVEFTDAEEGIGGRMVAIDPSQIWYGVATPTRDGFVNLDAWGPGYFKHSTLRGNYREILNYASRHSDGGSIRYFIVD